MKATITTYRYDLDLLKGTSTFPIFTPDKHFITYDGKHLTPAGTLYYSMLLNTHR